MAWLPEDIIETNPRDTRQLKSPLERLLDVAGTDLVILSETADELEARQLSHVAALFQLPYHVHVEQMWHRVFTLTHGLHADLKFFPCVIATEDFRSFKLFRSDDYPGWTIGKITQVIAIIPIWGIRALYHDRYLHHAARGGADNPIIVPQRDSWIDNRPIGFGDYEINFAARLIRELVTALRVFLPAYSVRTLQHVPLPKLLYSYHAMISPGRLVYAGQNVPILGASMESQKEREPIFRVSGTELATAMQTRYRNFSTFELQLFALERLRRDGEVTLALIGSLSLLEWLLNLYLIGTGGKKAKNLFRALQNENLDFLSSEEIAFLNKARDARNLAVHEKLPERGPSGIEYSFAGRELEGIASSLSTREVRELLEMIFRIFREINLRGIRASAGV